MPGNAHYFPGSAHNFPVNASNFPGNANEGLGGRRAILGYYLNVRSRIARVPLSFFNLPDRNAGQTPIFLYIVTNIAIVARVMTTAVIQPMYRSVLELARLPITFLLLVSNVTRTISGGASTPLRTAE